MIGWRLGCLVRVPQLPEGVCAIVHDFQWDDFQRQRTRITAAGAALSTARASRGGITRPCARRRKVSSHIVVRRREKRPWAAQRRATSDEEYEMNVAKRAVTPAGVRAVMLSATMFCSAVVSVRVLSTAAEQTPSAEPPKQPDEFRRRDSDGDGQLTLAEFLRAAARSEPAARLPAIPCVRLRRQRNTRWRRIPQLLAPLDERGKIPDPIVQAEQTAFAKWQEIFKTADEDGAGRLRRNEWPTQTIVREIPAVADVPFELWDRDRNGEVDDGEGRWLFEVAYGLTQPDGRPIRLPTGRVFAWFSFRRLDKDGDAFLSREEFVAGHDQGPEKNAELFARLDGDRDGRLTAEETLHILWHDNVAWFFTLDRDETVIDDRRIRRGGLGGAAGTQDGAAHLDADGDGKISFAEFRGSRSPTCLLTGSRRGRRRQRRPTVLE